MLTSNLGGRSSKQGSSKPAWNSSTKKKNSIATPTPTPTQTPTPTPKKQQKKALLIMTKPAPAQSIANQQPQPKKSRNPTVHSISSTVSSHSISAQSLKDLIAPAENKLQPTTSLVEQFEHLLEKRAVTDKELRENQKILRRLILTNGLPPPRNESSVQCPLRGRVWKVLLGVYKISALEYCALVDKQACATYEKIKSDTFRTLATDKNFTSKVDESMLSRLLNAFVWKTKDQPVSRLLNLKYSYVQGMNVIAAPFLYVMPEVDAFFTFNAFIHNSCPLYVQPALEGVHCGLKLMDVCLQTVDISLYKFLQSKNLSASIYAFPSDELLKLWDFLIAFGMHLNVLCVISQLLLIRDEIMQSSSPMKILRTLPNLDAKSIISVTISLIPQLSEDLYDQLVRHLYDPMIYDVIMRDGNVDR